MAAVCRSLVVLVASLWGTLVFAEATPKPAAEQALTAHEVVAAVTDETVAFINSRKDLLKKDPDAYYSKVSALLEPVVAFEYIAKVVMANHYKGASEAQREGFAVVFKTTMVETFAKGMANYSDFDIAVIPPEKKTDGQRKVEVIQEVKSKDGTHVVSYTMAQSKSGEWKLINVVLNGINLGKSFRDQFAQAMRQYNNDVDKVIAGWGQSSS